MRSRSGFGACVVLVPCLLLTPSWSRAQVTVYEEEYPSVPYSSGRTTDAVTRLLERVEAGEVKLAYHEGRGYLDSLLEALDIDPSSQALVFSKTSLKTRFITPGTPRALYFNDSVYVGFVQGSRSLEVAAMDPQLGPVFFDFSQQPDAEMPLTRELNRCLRCHDSYSLTGGGVPRFILSSVLAGPDGAIVSHEISQVTDTSTPLNRRWGGWYVTGTHGSQQHMGNLVIENASQLQRFDLSANGNRTQLDDLLDLEPYPDHHSDIVALLVLEHQVEVQNLITRVSFESRTLLDSQGRDGESLARLQEIVEPLVKSLLMANETALTDEVTGTSGFTDYFQALGPFDASGHSLRKLNLTSRTFQYPLSYLIYSPAFIALPEAVRELVYQRINAVLSGADQREAFSYISGETGTQALQILEATHPDFNHFVQ